MIIKSFRVQNFRCIKDGVLPCEQLTVILGPNGSGKSSFLRALDIFYLPNARFTDEDFYNRDTSQDIVITVTFTDLTGDERKLFQKYIEGGNLTVEKVMKSTSGKGSQKYYGTSLNNPAFDSFRSASGVDLRRQYNQLCEDGYPDLPAYTNKDDAEKALQAWEESHADQCSRRRDEGQFFGFKEVGEAHLERHTRFIAVPAVRDASEDAAEGRGTALTEIMDLVVRSVLSQRKEIIELQEGTQERYEQIVDPTKLAELQTLETDLGNTLKTYVPDAGVKLTWLAGDLIDIPMPKADIKVVEDGYPSSVERTGHGVQRAFILTMLQHLALAQSALAHDIGEKQPDSTEIPKKESARRIPNMIIGLEEPELYQHPNRQRHLSGILLKLATGKIGGVADCTQIIYSTHSPLFVDIRRVNNVRALYKVQEERNQPKQTKVVHTNLDEIAKIVEKADGKPEGTYTGDTLEPRLQALMTPWMNEGFFADVAVLVEGEEDRAAILGVARCLGYDLESMGISVIPCMGKNNLDRPTAIFSKLGIRLYVIWDTDYDSEEVKAQDNHRLLRLFDQPIEDWPEKVTDRFACFKQTLHKTLRTDVSEEVFDKTLEECCKQLCVSKKYALQNPRVIEDIINSGRKHGKLDTTLEKIIGRIIALRKPETADEGM